MAPGRDLQVEPAQGAAWARRVERGREAQEERVRAAGWGLRAPLKEPEIRAEARTWAAPAQAGEAAAAPWVEAPVQVEWEEEPDQVVQARVPVQAAEADRALLSVLPNPVLARWKKNALSSVTNDSTAHSKRRTVGRVAAAREKQLTSSVAACVAPRLSCAALLVHLSSCPLLREHGVEGSEKMTGPIALAFATVAFSGRKTDRIRLEQGRSSQARRAGAVGP